jgi:hypothetical protein
MNLVMLVDNNTSPLFDTLEGCYSNFFTKYTSVINNTNVASIFNNFFDVQNSLSSLAINTIQQYLVTGRTTDIVRLNSTVSSSNSTIDSTTSSTNNKRLLLEEFNNKFQQYLDKRKNQIRSFVTLLLKNSNTTIFTYDSSKENTSVSSDTKRKSIE